MLIEISMTIVWKCYKNRKNSQYAGLFCSVYFYQTWLKKKKFRWWKICSSQQNPPGFLHLLPWWWWLVVTRCDWWRCRLTVMGQVTLQTPAGVWELESQQETRSEPERDDIRSEKDVDQKNRRGRAIISWLQGRKSVRDRTGERKRKENDWKNELLIN